jgi:hypothetical protein
LSWDIVDAMSVEKELMLSPEGTVAEPLAAGADEVAADDAGAVDAGAVVVEDDDEQPAATMATTAAAATKPTLGRDLPWPCERECHPP